MVTHVRITLVPSRGRPVRTGSYVAVRTVAETGADPLPSVGVDCGLLACKERVGRPATRPVGPVEPVPEVHRVVLRAPRGRRPTQHRCAVARTRCTPRQGARRRIGLREDRHGRSSCVAERGNDR